MVELKQDPHAYGNLFTGGDPPQLLRNGRHALAAPAIIGCIFDLNSRAPAYGVLCSPGRE
jgi:hypothetical protein